MVNYENSVIYKLCCNDPSITDIYVGSTTNVFTRKCSHRKTCNGDGYKDHNQPVYQYIRCIGGFDNWDLVIIEEYPCKTKRELHTRERYWIEKLKATLNKRIPTRTQKEYEKDNIDNLRKYRHDYQQQNKDKIKEYKKQYHEKNIEQIKAKKKLYREKNRDKIKKKSEEKTTCTICGLELRRYSVKRHCMRRHKPDFAKIE